MKGISGNPVLDAYHRMAVNPVGGTAPVQGPAPAAAPPSKDHAEISISAKARGLASSDASVNVEKVADLKRKIEAGTFQVDATVVAQRLIDRLA
jgi:flagellar biosynthesis anti-sigma factor FlgM